MIRLYIVIPVGILAISTASIFVKLCDAPALVISAYRVVVASLVILPVVAYRKLWKEWDRKDLKWFLLSGTFLSLHFASWIASLKYTSVASSVILVNSHPLFVGVGAWLFLGEKPGLRLLAGLCLSFAGSALIGFGDMNLSGNAFLGDGLAILGALTASGYLLVGRLMRKEGDVLSYVFPVYAWAGIVLIALCLAFGKPLWGYSPTTYLYLLLLGLVPQLIGHTTFNWALKYLRTSMVAILILGEPVGSTILAYFLLEEALTFWKVAGGIGIFVGIVTALKTKD
jgi:drug/metabolite transporter (DMT)-like permease